MADEILIKVGLDTAYLTDELNEAKKLGNAAIQEIEKNQINFKLGNAAELTATLKAIAREGGAAFKGLENGVDSVVNDTAKLKQFIDQLTNSLKGMRAGSQEFKMLDEIIKASNTQLNTLNSTVVKSGESIRTQMRTSVQEVQKLVDKFGLASKEAAEAAKKAGNLRDTVGDANDLINAFKPGAGFGAVASALGGVASGFSAVQGAMGLIGSESEDVQKMLLKVNSAMALSQGIQGLSQARDSFAILQVRAAEAFRAIKAGIGSTGIGLFVLALGTIVAYWDDIKEAMGGVSAEQKKINSESEKNLKTQQEKLKTLNNQDNVLKLQGKTEKEIRNIKIAALNDAIAGYKLNIQNQISTLKSQYELGKRNKEILKGLIELTSIPIILILKAVDKVGSVLGKNFGLAEGFKDSLANFVFDPVGDAKKSIETIKSLEGELQNLENTRAGLIIENKKKEKETSKEVKEAKEKDFKNYSNTVKTGTEDLITTSKEYQDQLDNETKNIESVGNTIGDAYKRGYQTAEEYQQELIEKQKQAVNELLDFAQNGILITIGLNPNDVQRVRVSLEELKKTLDNSESTPAERAAAAAQAAGAAYQTVSNSIFAADTQRRQEELAALQGQQDEELRLAGDNEQKKELIKQKYLLKEKDIKRKQAEADKRKAIFDATVNTAVAVITGFVRGGPILAAIAAVLGAAQIALISATPIPKFAKGGAVPSSDIQGMINGRPHASGGVLIEAEGNEFITRKSQAMKGENLGLLEAINMSDSERDAYISRHYVMPALQAKESQAANNYRHSVIEAENNLIARVSGQTLKSIHKEQRNTTEAIKRLDKKNFNW